MSFILGIVYANLNWMYKESLKIDVAGTCNGYLLVDEMSIQQDLQVVRKGNNWHIVGAVALGPVINNLEVKMTSHCL